MMNSSSQIIPILIGEAGAAVEKSRQLYKNGYLISAVRPPAVPKGQSRLRISIMSSHTEEDIDGLISVL